MPRDERRMTFIVVPHGGGDLSTRSFEVSYRRLRVAAILLAVAAVIWVVTLGSWFWVAAQAARVPVLNREIAELQREKQRVDQLARTVARMEAQYERMRTLLGAGDGEGEGARQGGAAGEAGAPAEAPTEDDPAGDDAAGPSASLPRAWPLDGRGYVTRGLLARRGVEHPGMDIAVATGTPVRAAGAGTVTEAGEDPVYGRFVRIEHGGGWETLYGHASRLMVRKRQHVTEGQVIALSGNTGLSTAPHLHFEIRKDGAPVDPREHVRNPDANGTLR